jgi:hypothetical protein
VVPATHKDLADEAAPPLKLIDCASAGGGSVRISQAATPLETGRPRAHIAAMADGDELPVMEPFPDKPGTGWHVIIRYHQGHERRIDGFATRDEAMDWIATNATQLDK